MISSGRQSLFAPGISCVRVLGEQSLQVNGFSTVLSGITGQCTVKMLPFVCLDRYMVKQISLRDEGKSVNFFSNLS